MCGFVGLYNYPCSDASLLSIMQQKIAHRGPDACGEYRVEDSRHRLELAHRRLSIIDLSSLADQPFEKDGLVIAFNGEIYNFEEIKSDLESRGVAFRTHSDTEVLLEAWRCWGHACLLRLRGMFAFALYDVSTGTLILARDPFGIKPLFYARQGNGVAFASELKALLPALDRRDIDYGALASSLLYVWVPESHCCIQGVEKFPAGCWAECLPDGQMRLKRYWHEESEWFSAQQPRTSVNDLRQVIEDSMDAHMVADVPISTFLSGGLDSSIITALAARRTSSLDCYTITFRPEDSGFEAMPDDALYARKVAAFLGVKLHEIQISPDIASMLPEMVGILDEPIGDAAAINTYLICQGARKAGVKVLLSGMGADELFAGYRKHYANLLAQRYRRLPRLLRQGLIEPTIRMLPVAGKKSGYRTIRWAKRFMSFAGLPDETAFRRSYTYYDMDEMHSLLDRSLWPSADALVDEHRAVYEAAPTTDFVNKMCFTDVHMFMAGLNLSYTDRASMAASTEVRVPFIDKAVAKAAFAIPGHDKIRGSVGKWALKKAAEAWLPKEIIYRPKAPFSAPLRAWVRRDLRDMVDELLGPRGLAGRGFINGDVIQRMVSDDLNGRQDNAQKIWQLLTLEIWLRRNEGGFS